MVSCGARARLLLLLRQNPFASAVMQGLAECSESCTPALFLCCIRLHLRERFTLLFYPRYPCLHRHLPRSNHGHTCSHTITLGRVEFRIFLVLYFLTIPFQLISTGSFLEQGTTALTAITAIHAGLVAATFWTLLGNAIVSTQVVEDGTMSSLVVSASLELLPRPSPTGAGGVRAVSLVRDL